MGAEFQKLSHQLANKGFAEGSSRTSALGRELRQAELIPARLYNRTPLPDLSYMLDMQEEEVPGGGSGDQIKFYRKELGLSQAMLGELIGKNTSTISRLEAGQESSTVIALLKIIEALRLGRKRSEKLIEASGFNPKVIEIILHSQS